MKDTDCRKCGAKMEDSVSDRPKMRYGPFSGEVTAYICKKCGHWNDLKRRKANKGETE